jgi:hypothetical protein
VLLILICGAAFISIWGLFSSVLGEVSPPKGADPEQSIGLGNWLCEGYRFMRWAGRLLYLGIFLFPPALAATWFALKPWPGLSSGVLPLEEALGAIVAGGAVGLLGFRGSLSSLALGFRPIVRVALDVDNWLREHPRESNPTARISARYVSLLRYIAQWRSADHRPYDALIIFAHSQGTVVTADLLRYLNAEAREGGSYQAYDPALAGFESIPVYLFTMGCPLRQLYGLRFPYLYGYGDESAGGGAKRTASSSGPVRTAAAGASVQSRPAARFERDEPDPE